MTTKTALYALAASVVLNVFLVGVLIGPRVMRTKMGPPRDKPSLDGPRENLRNGGDLPPRGPHAANRPDLDERGERRLLRGLVDVLGGPRDPRVAGILEKHRAPREEQRRILETAREEAARALVATPYDEGVLRSKLEALGAIERKQKESAHGTLLELSRLLGDEDRARLRKRSERLEDRRD